MATDGWIPDAVRYQRRYFLLSSTYWLYVYLFFKTSYRFSGAEESVELLHIDVAAIPRLDS